MASYLYILMPYSFNKFKIKLILYISKLHKIKK